MKTRCCPKRSNSSNTTSVLSGKGSSASKASGGFKTDTPPCHAAKTSILRRISITSFKLLRQVDTHRALSLDVRRCRNAAWSYAQTLFQYFPPFQHAVQMDSWGGIYPPHRDPGGKIPNLSLSPLLTDAPPNPQLPKSPPHPFSLIGIMYKCDRPHQPWGVLLPRGLYSCPQWPLSQLPPKQLKTYQNRENSKSALRSQFNIIPIREKG